MFPASEANIEPKNSAATAAAAAQAYADREPVVLIVGGGIGGFVLICILIPICVIAVLAILGPQIGNIFSRITNGTSR